VTLALQVAPGRTESIGAAVSVGASTEDDDDSNNTDSVEVEVIRDADLEVTLRSSAPNVAPSERVIFTANIVNRGPSSASAAVVALSLPTNATVTEVADACTKTETIECALGDLDAGAEATVWIVATVATDAEDQVEVDAQVSAEESDVNSHNNEASLIVPVVGTVDVGLVLGGLETAQAGTFATFTGIISGLGRVTAFDVEFELALPDGATVVDWSGLRDCHLDGERWLCFAGDIQQYQESALAITLALDKNMSAGEATIGGKLVTQRPDENTDNNTDSISVDIVRSADLRVGLTAEPNGYAGLAFTFGTSIVNGGPTPATDLEVEVEVPNELRLSELPEPCEQEDSTVTCRVDELMPHKSLSWSFQADVEQGARGVRSLALSAASSEDDPDDGNSTAEAEITFSDAADISVSFIDERVGAEAGTRFDVDVFIANAGPARAEGDRLSIALPDGLQVVRTNWPQICEISAQRLECTTESLPPDGQQTIILTVEVDPDARGTLEIDATMAVTEADSDDSNNSATLAVSLGAPVDLGVTLTSTTNVPVAGGTIGYAATVRNNGPATATELVITLESGQELLSHEIGDGECRVDGGLICTVGELLPGASLTLNTMYQVAAGDGPPKTSLTASVSAAEEDPNETNDSDSIELEIARNADLEVTMRSSTSDVAAGERVVFTAALANLGVSDASAVVATFSRPANAAVIEIPEGCSLADAIECTLEELSAGHRAELSLVAVVAPDADGEVTLDVEVSADEGDINSENNTASLSLAIVGSVDIGLVLNELETAQAGALSTLTGAITGYGRVTALGVELELSLPNGVTVVESNGVGCFLDEDVWRCSADSIAQYEEREVAITLAFDEGMASGEVRIGGTLLAEQPDEEATNNKSSITLAIQRFADPRIELRADSTGFAGMPFPIGVTIINDGPVSVTDGEIEVALPESLVLGDLPAFCDLSESILTCRAADLAPRKSWSWFLEATVAKRARGEERLSAAIVSMTEDDPNPDDNDASTEVSFSDTADLRVSFGAERLEDQAGSLFDVEVSVSNAGPAWAEAISLDVSLPSGLEVVRTDRHQICEVSSQRVECDVDSLPPEGADIITVTVQAAPDARGTHEIGAEIKTGDADPDESNDSALIAVSLAGVADLAVTLESSTERPVSGETINYVAIVRNNGPATATEFTITLQASGAQTAYAYDIAGGECQLDGDLICDVAAISPGASVTLAATYEIGGDEGPVRASMMASISAAEDDPDETNNSAEVIFAGEGYDLAVSELEASAEVTAGEGSTLEIAVTNNGPSDAPESRVHQTLPPGVHFAEGSSDSRCALASNVYISEYVEGSGDNQAIELFNGGSELTMADCYLSIYRDGASESDTVVTLSDGLLAHGDTLVVCSSGFEAEERCDSTSDQLIFDGNDAIALMCNHEVVDVVGLVGSDPGTGWEGEGQSTHDQTLRRDCMATSGRTEFSHSTWDGAAKDAWDDLGSHTSCGDGPVVCTLDALAVEERLGACRA